MALDYYASFDFENLGGGTVTIGGSSTVAVTDGVFAHIALSADIPDLASTLESFFQSVDPSFTVTFDASALAYTIAHSSPFSLSWPGDRGDTLRRILGFSGALSGASSYTSNVRPFYAIRAQIEGRSQFTDVYEPPDLAEEAVADGGTAYLIRRDSEELWCDWQQPMETKEATLARAATSSVPFTWQHFFRHCGEGHPFAVVGDTPGATGTLYQLRANGATFNADVRKRVTADYDGLWSLQFYTRDLGLIP